MPRLWAMPRPPHEIAAQMRRDRRSARWSAFVDGFMRGFTRGYIAALLVTLWLLGFALLGYWLS